MCGTCVYGIPAVQGQQGGAHPITLPPPPWVPKEGRAEHSCRGHSQMLWAPPLGWAVGLGRPERGESSRQRSILREGGPRRTLSTSPGSQHRISGQTVTTESASEGEGVFQAWHQPQRPSPLRQYVPSPLTSFARPWSPMLWQTRASSSSVRWPLLPTPSSSQRPQTRLSAVSKEWLQGFWGLPKTSEPQVGSWPEARETHQGGTLP